MIPLACRRRSALPDPKTPSEQIFWQRSSEFHEVLTVMERKPDPKTKITFNELSSRRIA